MFVAQSHPRKAVVSQMCLQNVAITCRDGLFTSSQNLVFYKLVSNKETVSHGWPNVFAP